MRSSAKTPLAQLIDAHHKLPIAAVWGDGDTSSSDGQFFRSGKRGNNAGDVNARYGVDPGFTFYTHVSDQHGPYHATVISATAHEAPHVLDGLLHRGSSLQIVEHYTDTGGATVIWTLGGFDGADVLSGIVLLSISLRGINAFCTARFGGYTDHRIG
jgi:TnpA family transposase